VDRKLGSYRKCALSSSKGCAALKKQTVGRSAKLYREDLSSSQHSLKVFDKSTPKTTAREQFVIKVSLKLLMGLIWGLKEEKNHRNLNFYTFIGRLQRP
jgi:hypothetical protein